MEYFKLPAQKINTFTQCHNQLGSTLTECWPRKISHLTTAAAVKFRINFGMFNAEHHKTSHLGPNFYHIQDQDEEERRERVGS